MKTVIQTAAKTHLYWKTFYCLLRVQFLLVFQLLDVLVCFLSTKLRWTYWLSVCDEVNSSSCSSEAFTIFFLLCVFFDYTFCHIFCWNYYKFPNTNLCSAFLVFIFLLCTVGLCPLRALLMFLMSVAPPALHLLSHFRCLTLTEQVVTSDLSNHYAAAVSIKYSALFFFKVEKRRSNSWLQV